MNLESIFPRPHTIKNIQHGDLILTMGSCFATAIAEKFSLYGFRPFSNPMGTVFHPVPLARFVSEAIQQSVNNRLIQRQDVFLSWDTSSSVYAFDEKELVEQLNTLRNKTFANIRKAHTLFVTFGSAHAYRLDSTNELVANCHKQPSKEFIKELSDIEELFSVWSELIGDIRQLNPELQIVFTVSPVRYSRDGWVENNRSKARLIQLCEQLEEELNCIYLPVYELINDILRDYRYFETDGVHPNAQAIDEVWKMVRGWFFNDETNSINQEIEQLNSMSNHRIAFPGSLEAKRFLENLDKKKERFRSQFPDIDLD